MLPLSQPPGEVILPVTPNNAAAAEPLRLSRDLGLRALAGSVAALRKADLN